jgi:serine/threonine protein phosphatase PrpC
MILARDRPSGLAFAYGSATRQGARASQQDAIAAFERDGQLYVALADGVGGRPGGAEAAGVAVEAALSFIREAETGPGDAGDMDLPGRAVRRADAAVGRLPGAEDGKGPACTMVMCTFTGASVHFASVGDSHLIRFRGDEIHRLSIRQTAGVRTEIMALSSGAPEDWKALGALTNANALTDALTGQGTFSCWAGETDVLLGDIFLLCSDGLETISLDALSRSLPALMKTMKNPDAVAERVGSVIEAQARAGQDNATLGLVAYRLADSVWVGDAADGTGREGR